MKRAAVVLAALIVPSIAAAAETPAFVWPAPEGWKSETIPFPLEFAPDLPYKGLEELRFAPGMFKPTEEFFSYAFIWWLDGPEGLSAEAMSRGLEKYFDGLARAVEKKPGFKPEDAKATVRLAALPDNAQRFKGTANIYEAFGTHARLAINLRVELSRCDAQKKHVAMFLISPKPATHEMWKKLEAVSAAFKCGK